jgi:hypothetical protein
VKLFPGVVKALIKDVPGLKTKLIQTFSKSKEQLETKL